MSAIAEGDPSDNRPMEHRSSLVRTAGSAGGIMAVSLLLSRLLGLLRDTVIGSQFGLLGQNDSYRIAIQIPDMIFMLIAGGGLSSAFIPVFSELWYTGKKKEAWRVFSIVVTVCSVLAVLIIVVAWYLAPAIVASYGKDKPEVIPAALLMSRILLPAQFAFLIGSVILGTLYARKQFIGPGLAPNVYNIGIIVGAAVLPAIFHFGIIGVAWGALAGAFIGNLVLPIVLMIPSGMSFVPSFDVRNPGVKKFFHLLLPVIIGFSLPSMVSLVTQYFGAAYGEGSNTALSYSNNLMQAPLAIFGQSFALGVFPILSQLYAEKRMVPYRDMVSTTLRTVIYFGVPSAVLMFAMSPLIIKVIYGYGKAGAEPGQLALISDCLKIYCLAIPAWCLQPTLIRGFFSLHKTLKPVALGTAMTALYIAECLLIRSRGMPLTAFAWATDIASVLLVVILFIALEGEIGRLARRAIFMSFARCILAAIPAGLLGFVALGMIPVKGKLITAMFVLLLFSACCAIYFAGTKMLGMTEAQSVLRRFKRRAAAEPSIEP